MRITVVAKIIAGFALFGILLLITNVLTYSGLSGIRDSANVVINENMPELQEINAVQLKIGELRYLTLKGYQARDIARLSDLQARYQAEEQQLKAQLVKAEKQLKNPQSKQMFREAEGFIQNYMQLSSEMFVTRQTSLKLANDIAEMFKQVKFHAEDAGANLLDMAYLDNAETDKKLAAVVGAGNRIDYLLVALVNSSKEYIAEADPTNSQTIAENMRLAIGDLQTNSDFINRLAIDVNTDGLMDAFNEQREQLLTLLEGDSGLVAAQQKRINLQQAAATKLQQAETNQDNAYEQMGKLLTAARSSTEAGQNNILDVVESNITRSVVIMVFAIVVLVVIGFLVSRSIYKPLERIRHSLRTIANGNLTHHADTSGNDEFSSLARNVNSLADSLREVVNEIATQANNLELAIGETVELSNQTSQQMDQQQNQIAQTSESTSLVRNSSHAIIGEINQGMQRVAEASAQASQVGDMVSMSREQATSQARQADASAAIIHRLNQNSTNISGILDVIKNIAEQTNLLALNAAIEAARAGEQGRGFAVVADEVRTLANRTSQSTSEIEQMIMALQTDATQAVEAIERGKAQASESLQVAEQVDASVSHILHAVQQIDEANRRIAEDAKQQDSALDQISSRLNSAVALAQQSVQTTEATAQASRTLSRLVENLRSAINRFNL
ncbi:methyl-accepting chemotaxis protein [Bowmanella sp. JS7-9]|uniref:Methyl-accepting chemotaxis protein n=1 Tax=Pseudobowmanella zhangzhouensis TaxID=1537679 RepID=A0ABW1XJH2_9ALTE|nr:methyl-accepting chemotaxis protein [Bowmanella sp. JS7-9]TBX23184.1 hypothetical protein TK45_08225 [Bowmanella sp. JS7-9]